MTDRETMKQAMYLIDAWQCGADADLYFMEIAELRQALAQGEQETVELKHLRDVHAAQGFNGNWNSDQYMCGLFNGLELALAIFENREPVYKELAQPEQAHTDHPMRHWDRTCPACVAEPWDTSDMAYRPNGLSVEQEPVAWMAWNMEDECYVITTDKRRLPAGTPLYTAPPSKPWFDLSDMEKDAARYRWIRNSTTDVSLVLDKRTNWIPPYEGVPEVGGHWEYEYRAGDELDEAIDRAIEAASKELNT